jgi:hypothetical protein
VENFARKKKNHRARVILSLSLKDAIPKSKAIERERKKDDDTGERVFSREREEREKSTKPPF